VCVLLYARSICADGQYRPLRTAPPRYGNYRRTFPWKQGGITLGRLVKMPTPSERSQPPSEQKNRTRPAGEWPREPMGMRSLFEKDGDRYIAAIGPSPPTPPCGKRHMHETLSPWQSLGWRDQFGYRRSARRRTAARRSPVRSASGEYNGSDFHIMLYCCLGERTWARPFPTIVRPTPPRQYRELQRGR